VLLIFGLFGEIPESEKWKRTLFYNLAKWAVVLGVVGELVADSVIFKAAEREQQITNESIESNLKVQRAMRDQLKPRDISKEQIATISAAIRDRMPTIDLYTLSDVEASKYAFAISETLKAGKVDVRLMLSGTKAVPTFPDKFNVAVAISGVTVVDSNKVTVSLLIGAFDKAGIQVLGETVSGGVAGVVDGKWVADAGVKTPAIFVGLKPVPFSRFPAFSASEKM
jgi:hypothetical protein